MSNRPPDPAVEEAGVRFLRHFEWQAGFSFLFLFADTRAAAALADWLDQRLAFSGIPLNRIAAPADFAERPEALLESLLAQMFAPDPHAASGNPGAPFWLELHGQAGNMAWNRARSIFLARLNERRFVLERDAHAALVLVLPAGYRAEARNIAPDIWHVRAFSEEIGAPRIQPAREVRPPTPSTAPPRMEAGEVPEYAEWQRIRQSEPGRLYLPAGWSATAALLDAGGLEQAGKVAAEVLALARSRLRADAGNTGLSRDLSVSLDNVGRVSRDLGDLEAARAAYAESLALSRQLRQSLGDTPGGAGAFSRQFRPSPCCPARPCRHPRRLPGRRRSGRPSGSLAARSSRLPETPGPIPGGTGEAQIRMNSNPVRVARPTR